MRSMISRGKGLGIRHPGLKNAQRRAALRQIVVGIMAVAMFANASAQDWTSTGMRYPVGRQSSDPTFGFLGYNSAFKGYHLAWDFARAQGTPVFSVADGRVVYSRNNVGSYGGDKLVGGGMVLEHKFLEGGQVKNFYVLYGHLATNRLLPVGTTVSAGQEISAVGSYILSSGRNLPHLHLAIRPYAPAPSDNNPWRGYTTSASNTYGWVHPIDFLTSCVPVNGTRLLRAEGEATVWMIRNGARRAIPSAQCFEDWGFNWGSVVVVPRTLITQYQWDIPLQHLIKVSNDATVYRIQDGKRRPIVSAPLFDGMGFRWDDIRVVSNGRRDSYGMGVTLSQNEGNFIVVDGPYIGPANPFVGQNTSAGLRIRNIARANPAITSRFAVSFWNPSGVAGNFPWSDLVYIPAGGEWVWWSDWRQWITFSQRGYYPIKPANVVNGTWYEIPHSGITPPAPYGFTVR